MKNNNRKPSATDTVWENIKQFGIAIILAIIIKTSVVEAYKIPSQSMEGTLLVGDFLMANKFIYGSSVPLTNWKLPGIKDPEPGDVVIFIFPGDGVTKYIKRCIAVAGDTVEVRDKILYVNGQKFENPEHIQFIDTLRNGQKRLHPRPPRDNFGPHVVKADSYFMMGDNRDNSYDSRFWGEVHKSLILGKAMVIHWSWDDSIYQSPEISAQDPLSVPRMFVYNTIHFFEKVRWSRLFNIIN